MKSQKCGNNHDGLYGSGKFCSRSCANSRTHSEKTKQKMSKALKGNQPWNTGTKLSDEHKEKIAHSSTGKIRPRIPDNEVFVENCSVARHVIKKRIIRDKLLDYKCAICGQEKIWNGKELSLQLDHINGINNDHRLKNLRFLCPNCHTQQDTYSAKNRLNALRQPKKYVTKKNISV